MDITLPVLKVQMLGGLSLMFGEKPISFSRNTTTKAMKLLQILLYYGEKGISRNKLIENLYKAEELADGTKQSASNIIPAEENAGKYGIARA